MKKVPLAPLPMQGLAKGNQLLPSMWAWSLTQA